MGHEGVKIMSDIERGIDIYRIMGQLESSINSIISQDREFRIRQQNAQDKIYRLIHGLKDDISAQRDFIYCKVDQESKHLKELIDLKFDIESATMILKEIDNIKGILGIDNSNKVKRNWKAMNNLMNYILYSIGAIGLISTILFSLIRLLG